MWERMRESKRQPHPQKALTVRAVQAAQAGDRTRRIGDGGGLFLIVFPSGAKSWVLRTVVKGKRCDLGLGSATLTSLAEAREEARRLRRIARTGGDPLAERRHERRPVPTFEQAARQVHACLHDLPSIRIDPFVVRSDTVPLPGHCQVDVERTGFALRCDDSSSLRLRHTSPPARLRRSGSTVAYRSEPEEPCTNALLMSGGKR